MLYLFIFTLAASQALRKNHQPSCEQEEQEGDGEERRAGEGETRRGEHEEEQTAGHQVSTKRGNVKIWMNVFEGSAEPQSASVCSQAQLILYASFKNSLLLSVF